MNGHAIIIFVMQINLIAPPRYVMTTTTLERTEGLSILNQAMAAIKEKIEEKRGVFNIQMEVSNNIAPAPLVSHPLSFNGKRLEMSFVKKMVAF